MASITLDQIEVSNDWNTTSQIHMAKGRNGNAHEKDGQIS